MNILAQAIEQAKQPASDRTQRYCDRLDKHLASLPDKVERLKFLRRELNNWLNRYKTFCGVVDSGRYEHAVDGPTAWDYTLTINELDRRIGRLSRQPW